MGFLSLCLVLASACSSKNTHEELKGPYESGGGDPNRLTMEGMESELSDSVYMYHRSLGRLARLYQKMLTNWEALDSNVEPEHYKKMRETAPKFAEVLNWKLLLEVADKTKGGKTIVEAAQKLNVPLVLNGEPCKDAHDNSKTASATYPGRICVSVSELAKTTRYTDGEATVRSLLMHELAHKAGLTSEKDAKHLEALFWFVGRNVDYEFPIKFSNSLGILRDTEYRIQGFYESLKSKEELHGFNISQVKKSLQEDEFAVLYNDTREIFSPSKEYASLVERWSSFFEKNFRETDGWHHKESPLDLAQYAIQYVQNRLQIKKEVAVEFRLYLDAMYSGLMTKEKEIHLMQKNMVDELSYVQGHFTSATNMIHKDLELDNLGLLKEEEELLMDQFRTLQIVVSNIVSSWDNLYNEDLDYRMFIRNANFNFCEYFKFNRRGAGTHFMDFADRYLCQNPEFTAVKVDDFSRHLFVEKYRDLYFVTIVPIREKLEKEFVADYAYRCAFDQSEPCEEMIDGQILEDILPLSEEIKSMDLAPSLMKYMTQGQLNPQK